MRAGGNSAKPAVVALLEQTQSSGATRCMLDRGDIEKMKRKPDLLWVLVIIFSLGVVTTGYTQVLWDRNSHLAEITQP